MELKRIPLGNDALAFVGQRPFTLAKSSLSTEFDSPVLSVQRIILSGKLQSHTYDVAAPSLLVALTPANVATQQLRHGDVWWTTTRFEVQPTGPPVHLLVITPK